MNYNDLKFKIKYVCTYIISTSTFLKYYENRIVNITMWHKNSDYLGKYCLISKCHQSTLWNTNAQKYLYVFSGEIYLIFNLV